MKKIGKRLILVSSIRVLGFFFIFLTSSFCLLSHAAVITVPGDYSTIQAAIDTSTDGDEIIVSQGTYYENVNFLGKNIILRSTEPTSPTVVASTVIDGRSTDSVVTFSGTELTTCVLSGFTLTKGRNSFCGGGINGSHTLATIRNNIISGNWAKYGGGLAECNGTLQNNIIVDNSGLFYGGGLCWCDGAIQNNAISGNRAYRGGGLYECDGIIRNNTIVANVANDKGGGFSDCGGSIQNNTIRNNSSYIIGGGLSNCDGIIHNNTIGSNSADFGGGLYQCNGTVQNNVISGNSAEMGGGLLGCDGTIQNNLIISNTADSGGGLYQCNGTVQNNSISYNSAYSGGGLNWCDGTITNNTIVWNSANYHGGGLDYCNGVIEHNTISGNSSDWGGGLCECGGIIRNNTISWNLAYEHGGGLASISLSGRGIIQNNTISDNAASDCGGGIYGSNSTLLNNTISGNWAACGGGLYSCKGLIVNCIIAANVAAVSSQLHDCGAPFFSCIQDWTGDGRGNISADSRFVDPDNGNYHLQADSPCIDAGITYYLSGEYIADIDGECRVMGRSVDMGSDEYGSSLDSDGDLLANNDEVTQGLDPNKPDTDGDGLCDGVEVLRGTNPDFYNTPSGISIPVDYPFIQEGVFMAFPGEAVTLAPGRYHENISFLGKNVTVQSEEPRDDTIVASTIIDGDRLFSVILFEGTEDQSAAVKGITICNGAASSGGGICGNRSLATITNNRILDNSAEWSGGGLYWCDGTIQNNIIERNTAYYGGGLSSCYGVIQNNIITSNSAIDIRYGHGSGGGLSHCYASIQNNTIVYNSAQNKGGGLFSCRYGQIRDGISNCIIWQNEAHSGPQLYDCIAPSYSCIQDWTGGGEGNISSDPQLVDPDNDDFHLLPSSPCIDAGGYVENLTEDFESEARPMNGSSEPRGDGSDFDIGADEFPGAFAVRSFDFDLTEEGWGLVEISHFTPPYFDYTPGQLILTAQDNTNTYGFWTSELDAVPVIADCLYRATWTVATDVTDPLAVPNMLLRVNSQNYQQADMLVVSSAGDGSYAPTPEGRTYEMYFVPPESALGKPEDQDDLILSFDIMNFDARDDAYGSLMLDRVVVEAIPLDTLSTPTMVKTWSFETDSEGWEFGTVPIFTASLSGIGAGALWLIAQDNTNTFGFWSGPSEEVEMEEGKLYRLRFTVITDVIVLANVPQLRLRVSSEDFQSSIVKLISSVTGAEMSPTPEGRSYDLYFYPPQSLLGTPQNGFLAAFDILNFDPGDSASAALMLDGVVVESFNLIP